MGFSEEHSREFSDINSPLLTGEEGFSGTSDLSFDANWFGTIRGRLGFAADNLLFYGTGGLAYGHMEASFAGEVSDYEEAVSYEASTETTNWGWTVGAGMEYGIDNWSLGLEYLYVDLGDGQWNDNSTDGQIHNFKLDGNVDYAFSTVRATVKYRFQ